MALKGEMTASEDFLGAAALTPADQGDQGTGEALERQGGEGRGRKDYTTVAC